MKLFTEEQVRRAIVAGMHIGYSNQFNIDNISNEVDSAIKYLTPIELPSDEEIDKRFDTGSNRLDSQMYESGFRDGSKWMKEQILNQTK